MPGGVNIVPEGARMAQLSQIVRDPDGNVIADLGVVSYWHRNPLRRAWWRLVGLPAARRRIAAYNAANPLNPVEETP